MTTSTQPAEPSQDVRAWLAEVLGKVAKKRLDVVAEYIESVSGEISNVDILGARCAVETVKAYGLELDVDANGNAVSVHFPYGAEVSA